MDDEERRDEERREKAAGRLAAARGGDAAAFELLLRPHLPALAGVAAAATADQARTADAVRLAVTAVWRDVRALRSAEEIPGEVARAGCTALADVIRAAGRRPGGFHPQAADDLILEAAIRTLRPRDHALIAGCVDAAPSSAALAVAARLGVEDQATAPFADAGAIVNLDGPLADWTPERLRDGLRARARAVDPADLAAIVARATDATRPASRVAATLRRVLPPLPALLGAGAAAVALAAGIGALSLATFAAGPSPSAAVAAGQGGAASRGSPGPGLALVPLPSPAFAPFPGFAAGLAVSDVPGVVERHRAGDTTPIAVKGWWSGTSVIGGCATFDPGDDPAAEAAAFCARTARLSLEPDTDWRAPHIHVQALPGTSLAGLDAATRATRGGAIPVVLIGHFGDPAAIPCGAASRRCGQEFVVDRLAWVDRIWIPVPALVSRSARGTLPRLDAREVDRIVNDAYPSETLVFSVTGVRWGDISAVEPTVMAGRPTRGSFMDSPAYVWLVRIALPPAAGAAIRRAPSMTPAPTVNPAGGAPDGLELAWVLVNDADARIIGTSLTRP